MIDQHGRTQALPRRAARLPVPAGAARALILAAVFVCAACGLVYELELVALASYLVGDSVTQASVVLSVMVFAMGCGSLLAKRLRARAAAAFAAVESALALIGGLSVMALYGFFAWYGQARPAMVGCAFAIGVLIGAEVPLLMTLVQRIRRQDAGGAVADLFAADYVGALVGGLAFPFLLLPRFGQLTGALATGVVNAVAGGAVVLWLFRSDLTRRERGRLLVANVLVLAVLGGAAWAAGPFERAARRAVYGGDVRVAEQTPLQELVLTGGAGRPLRLYLDGRLAVCGSDAAAYGQALAGPALSGAHARVLVLGGGDGVVAGQVLGHGGVQRMTVVDADPGLLRLGRTDSGLGALNGHVFGDPRVRAVAADPFDWLRSAAGRAGTYDVILADLPAPGQSRAAKYYSQEFYGLAGRVLAPGGRLAVHTDGSLWTVRATLRAAGLSAAAYRAPGPACTPSTFLLAGAPLPSAFPPIPPPQTPPPPPSTLLHPRL
jgi:spermidine synthase